MKLKLYIPEKGTANSLVAKYGTPLFVSNKNYMSDRVSALKDTFGDDFRIFYAMKANFNPSIISLLKESGVEGIDAVSPFEVKLAKKLGFLGKDILFTGSNATEEDMKVAHSEGALLNIGSLVELENFGKLFPGSVLSIRFNTEIGEGEFKEVVTGGVSSKFGIMHDDTEQIEAMLKKYNLRLIGVHSHIGSGIYNAEKFKSAVDKIADIAINFSKSNDIKFINIGGGLGVRYRPGGSSIDLKDFYKNIKGIIKNLKAKINSAVQIIMEPGKFLVAESTCLLTRVVTVKNNKGRIFIGTDTGLNHIIRPMLYDVAYHHIENVSREGEDLINAQVVGNICESSDVIGEEVSIVMPKEGDVLSIYSAGAYCASMSSFYNLRPYAAEIMLDDITGDHTLIRKRQTFLDAMSGLGYL